MRVDDLSLFDLFAMQETLKVLAKIGHLDVEVRFDLTPGRPVRVTLPSLVWPAAGAEPGGGTSSLAEPEPAGEAVAALPPPDVNTRGGLSPVAREGEAEAEPPSPVEVGASVPASGDCEPVASVGAVDHTVAQVAAAVPAGDVAAPPAVPDFEPALAGLSPFDPSAAAAGEVLPSPAVQDDAVTPLAVPDDEIGRHLFGMTVKGGWDFRADHRLLELACLGWRVPDIAAEMGRADLDVKRRFDLLLDGRKFKREDVRDRLAGFLALAAE
jgi:hypothetical protein